MKILALGFAMILQSTVVFAATDLSFSCKSTSSKTYLEVSLQGSVEIENGAVEITQTMSRPSQTVVETFQITRSNMRPYYGKGIKFVETWADSNHLESYQMAARSLVLPQRLFSSRPYRQFEATLESLETDSGHAQIEFFKCQLN